MLNQITGVIFTLSFSFVVATSAHFIHVKSQQCAPGDQKYKYNVIMTNAIFFKEHFCDARETTCGRNRSPPITDATDIKVGTGTTHAVVIAHTEHRAYI